MKTPLPELQCVLRIAASVCGGVVLSLAMAGCGRQPELAPPVFSGDHYAAVVTNTPTQGMPQAGQLALYYYPDGPKGACSLVWPYITSQNQVVFDKLAVFNGGLSEEVSWKYYPALLACNGGGEVVEISQPACRKIPGFKPDWTNYAFSLLAVSNEFVRLDASQTGAIQTNQPLRLEVDISKDDVLKAMSDAQKQGGSNEYQGVKYLVAP